MPRRESVRMRPIAAPDDAVRRRGDHRSRVGDHLDERQTEIAVDFTIANLVGAADLHPDMRKPEEVEQQLKTGLLQAFRRFYPGNMIDDYWNRHIANAVFPADQVFHVDVEI